MSNGRLSLTADEKAFGERLKATKVAICEFLARQRPALTDPSSFLSQAANIAAYSISSRRHLLAMESELSATIRELRRQMSRKTLTPQSYEALVAHLRSKELIDISVWTDRDALRVKRLLDKGEIRTVAQWRLVSEYRDTISDPDVLSRLDETVALYETKRGLPAAGASRLVGTPATGRTQLSPQDLERFDLLKRSAIESFEYAAEHGKRDEAGTSPMKNRAEVWRSLSVENRRDLHDAERGFWVALGKLRRNRLSQDQFEKLTAKLRADGLIDISKLSPASRRAAGK